MKVKQYCDECVWSEYDNETLGLYCEVKNEDINSLQKSCDNFCCENRHFGELVKYGKFLQEEELKEE